MTDAAKIIARMEAAASPAEQAAVQSGHPMDALFRDVLSLAYDPYEQFGTPLGLDDPEPITDPDAVDRAMDPHWFVFADGMRAGLGYENAVRIWRRHAIWPVAERVLRKRITGVSFATVNSVWGTLPLFDVGDVKDEEAEFPCYAMPVRSRQRRIVVVRPRERDDRARIDVFDPNGQCCNTLIGDVIARRLRSVDWRGIFSQSTYESGVVLDGWVDDAQESFSAFDGVPLQQFRVQTLTRSYFVRLGALQALQEADVASEGLHVVEPEWLENREARNAIAPDMLALARGLGVIGIDPEAPYPYRASHAWRWLYRPGAV